LPLIGGFITSALLLIGGFSERPAGWDERGDHGGGDGVRDQLQDVLPPLFLLPLRLSQGQQHSQQGNITVEISFISKKYNPIPYLSILYNTALGTNIGQYVGDRISCSLVFHPLSKYSMVT
jgi:hypothetical protein